MSRDSFEVNFDGLVGPTHHYAGLSVGNIASTRNAKAVSQPRKAALQGLAKAAMLRDLGLKQGILPPLRRPRLDILRALGFTGTDASVIERAYRSVPQLLSACYSASSMWVANAATFSPSSDTASGKPHFTPANLSSKFHRSLEPKQTAANLKAIFGAGKEEGVFNHHDPILAQFGDEGAANHGRLAPRHGAPGIELFVFGGSVLQETTFAKAKKFPARQSIEASHAIATHHGLNFKRTLLLQQNPDAIDAGVFHNDVVSVTNENVFFVHERAFQDQAASFALLRTAWKELPNDSAVPLQILEVLESEVSLEDAVKSYLFNSQLVTLPATTARPQRMALLCPEECREIETVRVYLEALGAGRSKLGKTPIEEVHYLDLRESMQNGGGPACLRLRVVLTAAEIQAVHPGIWLTTGREKSLQNWITKHYRERLAFDDLGDPKFFQEVQSAMDDLERVLGISLA